MRKARPNISELFDMKKPYFIAMAIVLAIVYCFPRMMSAKSASTLLQRPHQNLAFEHLLENKWVFGCLQDHQGFMWFNTDSGLYRYDGYKFTVFLNDPDDPHSISGNVIPVIYEDRNGTLWVGTNSGLARFNRHKERFTPFYHDPNDPNSISHNFTQTIHEDRSSTLWIGTQGGGVNQFDGSTGKFNRYRHRPNDRSSLSSNDVRAIHEDRQGNLWIGTSRGLNRLDRNTGRCAQYLHDPEKHSSPNHQFIMSLFEDEDGLLWVGTREGVNRFDPVANRFIDFKFDPNQPHNPSGTVVRSFYRDHLGTLWISTDEGLYGIHRETGKITRYAHDPRDAHGLRATRTFSVYEDRTNALWVSTFGGGVHRTDPGAVKFQRYSSDPQISGLSQNAVRAIYEDTDGILWVGTESDGLNRIDRTTGRITHFRHDPDSPDTLGSNWIRCITEDREGKLWIGTWDGGGLNRFDKNTGKVQRYQHDPRNPASIASDNVDSLIISTDGMIWVGTWGGGLNRFDPETEKFTRLPYGDTTPDHLSSPKINYLMADRQGYIWINTLDGLNRFDRRTGRFDKYRHHPGVRETISSDISWVTHEDRNGTIWIGTTGGLNKFYPDTGHFRHYGSKDGLAGDGVNAILEDDTGRLWISTTGGLSRFDPYKGTFKNYDTRDGLQGDHFNPRTAFKNANGELFFGGANGFNAFFPDQITENPYIPPVVLTDFQILNRSVPIAEKGSVLKHHINETDHIILGPEHGVFSIEFAALNYRFPQKNRYAYQMVGFDSDRNHVDSNRRYATYTHLPAGSYVFKVQAANNDGVWNTDGKTVHITILPPWWKTWWARTLFSGSILAALLGLAHLRIRSQARALAQKEAITLELNRELEERVRDRTARLEAANKELEAFSYSVSHDLRAPLRHISGFIKLILKRESDKMDERSVYHFGIIADSIDRMHQLIEGLLAFSRAGRKEMHTEPVSLNELVETVRHDLLPEIGKRDIEWRVDALPTVNADPGLLRQVWMNLLANAIKYTARQPDACIEIRVADSPEDETDREELVTLFVRDNGVGFDPQYTHKLFGVFQRLHAVEEFEGTGIGLAIIQRIIARHGGTIRAKGELDKGATFYFTLPLAAVASEEREAIRG